MGNEERRLRDRLAEWDDRSAWDDDSFFWRHDVLSMILCEIAAGAVFAVACWLLGPVVGVVILTALTIALMAAYLVWRRRRNRRLTGSPTRWP